MKILHIAGWSGSGKTTFILELLGKLTSLGKTGTIKHIGSHYTPLPVGKDTTLHFESGADLSVGIDFEKSTLYFRSIDLHESLNLLSDSGVRYAIVEGFKNQPFQKILLGDLDCHYILKNPGVEEVIPVLSLFDDWYTLSGLSHELKLQCPDSFQTTWSGYARDYYTISQVCMDIEQEFLSFPGIDDIRLRVQRWSPGSFYPVYLLLAHDSSDVTPVIAEIVRRLNPYMIQPVSPENRKESDYLGKS